MESRSPIRSATAARPAAPAASTVSATATRAGNSACRFPRRVVRFHRPQCARESGQRASEPHRPAGEQPPGVPAGTGETQEPGRVPTTGTRAARKYFIEGTHLPPSLGVIAEAQLLVSHQEPRRAGILTLSDATRQ